LEIFCQLIMFSLSLSNCVIICSILLLHLIRWLNLLTSLIFIITINIVISVFIFWVCNLKEELRIWCWNTCWFHSYFSILPLIKALWVRLILVILKMFQEKLCDVWAIIIACGYFTFGGGVDDTIIIRFMSLYLRETIWCLTLYLLDLMRNFAALVKDYKCEIWD